MRARCGGVLAARGRPQKLRGAGSVSAVGDKRCFILVMIVAGAGVAGKKVCMGALGVFHCVEDVRTGSGAI